MLPAARTRDEAHLYMDLSPCDCGEVDVTWHSALADEDGALVRRYSGTCPGCGTAREFRFAAPERPGLPGPDQAVYFGGDDASQLLDPGEWLLVAELCAEAGSQPASGAAERAEARESLAIAVAAIEEVLKFVPAGRDAVPDVAFWSARGRQVRDREPGRFERRRLVLVRDAYQDALDRM